MPEFWKNKRVCVTGGAGFIGSHLADALVKLTKSVVVADDFSSGCPENIPNAAETYSVDLRDYKNCLLAIEDCDVVFHLASDVGGRAYLSNNNYRMWGNLELDSTVLRASVDCGVKKFIYFSSACVYPTDQHGYIHESQRVGIKKADGVYGITKLIGEAVLDDCQFDSIVIRPFTVFGERMPENRSIGALIAKTFIRQDPFEVWGDGNQVVDWIYAQDVVKGALLAAERVTNRTLNIGSGMVRTPMGALNVIWDYVGWRPQRIVFKTDMPVNPQRLSDNTRIRDIGWNMDTPFEKGIKKTVDWYYATHDAKEVRETLERRLLER